MTLKLNQRFETNDEFVGVFNIESKKIFDIWTEFDCKKATVRHLYLCQIHVHLSVNRLLTQKSDPIYFEYSDPIYFEF